jgi:glycosyltransferase involved in cell wall biosynthesis
MTTPLGMSAGSPVHTPVQRSLKIALVAGSLAQWGGGNDFLRLCAAALWQKQKSLPITFSLLLADERPPNSLRRYLSPWKRMLAQWRQGEAVHYTRYPFVRPAQSLESIKSFGGELDTITYADRWPSNGRLIKILKRGGYDAVAPFAASPGKFPLPWVGYIPDLQHKHLPQYFSSRECRERDRHFTQLLRDAKAIIVNSWDAKRDLEHFYPGYSCVIFDLPFAPILNPQWLDDAGYDAQARYRLPEQYFLISNQFWVHKSHLTAFEALARLGASHPEVSIVCTGNTSDYRQPEYFPELTKRIAELGLQNRIVILGRIPKREQIEIMRKAVAVIQPTLFEGGPGGGSVYDAICIGTPVILSDIAINQEVDMGAGSVRFFCTASAEDLAEKMEDALMRRSVPLSHEELLHRSEARAERLGSRLLEAIEYAYSTGKS